MATELVSFVYTTDVMAKAVVIGRSNWILMVAYQALGACVLMRAEQVRLRSAIAKAIFCPSQLQDTHNLENIDLIL